MKEDLIVQIRKLFAELERIKHEMEAIINKLEDL